MLATIRRVNGFSEIAEALARHKTPVSGSKVVRELKGVLGESAIRLKLKAMEKQGIVEPADCEPPSTRERCLKLKDAFQEMVERWKNHQLLGIEATPFWWLGILGQNDQATQRG